MVFVKQRHVMIVGVQVVLIVCSAALAWFLRFEFHFRRPDIFFLALPLLLMARLLAMVPFNLFHGYWRYTGVSDAFDVVKAVFLGTVGFVILERYVVGNHSYPLSIYCIEAMLTTAMLCGVRIASRTFMHRVRYHASQINSKGVVVIGAGCGAAMLLRELPRSGYTALALVDDDPAKVGVKLSGVLVAGKIADLQKVVYRYHPEELMIAIPSANREEMRRIADHCQKTGLRFRTIPSLTDMIHGDVPVNQLRDVNLEDLLGREPVQFHLESVRRKIAGRVVMVSGAAGSIGSELCHQLLNYAPAKLVCVDQAETPLFHLQQLNLPAKVEKVFCVADITDGPRMREVIREHDVRVIFHAAAYKHVPLMEENLQEAVKNNVFGLLSLMEVADQAGCEDFLLISSDKAVCPTSFMGCTKRIGELIVAARPSAHMRCLSVRFGNVLGSQGSVIPLFQEQIKTRREITVTHPEITRYFMTIPEAVSLVLQGFSIGEKGDILVLDMGEPVKILEMAKSLIHLSGIPPEEVKIVFTGLRPGEKLFEELFYDFEQRLNTTADKILRTQGQLMTWMELQAHLHALRAENATGVSERIRAKVKEIVPQYLWTPAEQSLAAVAIGDGAARHRAEVFHQVEARADLR
jgi:FlaA1/EpsC-like NDP-sugar epimerase